jgi:hypothetical protein
VELTTGDSMMPGRTFKDGQQIEVLARASLSGNAVGASGDPFGLIATRVGNKQVLELTIDRAMP